ncbi:amino acid/amide ABC transporter substrate-binding protein, HAAT family [Variovorax sp. HW608]|uniref:ABC transporter substrate-binding protein n=1 Tax=Variovorax sp. HW608 TaxID=1034889 RepID=UPI00081FED00|nr:ABC transporter substrate-binding protein [Variovorax sp. HW608]SCK24329.1 amino acid/amide ABC transporter substrate-binding protein, HAAT family [Variovorax sp. HW608]
MNARALSRWILGAATASAMVASALAADIVVGQVAPLTGLEAKQGLSYAAGLRLAFDSVNKQGGVNGNTFTLVRVDDHNEPASTVEETRKLVAEQRPLVLAGYFGSRNVAALLASGILDQQRLALVGYRTTGVPPAHPLLFNVRADVRDELAKLTQHLATMGITRLGLLHEAGADAVVAAADEAAGRAKVAFVVRASYAPDSRSTGTLVSAFLKTPPQAIIMVANGGITAAFIERYRSEGGAAQLFAYSGADVEQLSQRLGEEQMKGVVISQVTPNPYKNTSRLTREFTEAAKAHKLDVPVSYVMMEGYIAGRVIIEAARRQGRTPTREAMASTLNAMNDYDLGGYAVGFRPGARAGSKYVELSIISSEGKIQQ